MRYQPGLYVPSAAVAGEALAFVAAGAVASSTSAFSLSPEIPAGSFGILFVHVQIAGADAGPNINTPSGWTLIDSASHVVGAGFSRLSAFYKASPSAVTATFDYGTGSGRSHAVVLGYNGVNVASPVESVVIGTGAGTSQTTTASPTLTASVVPSIAIAAFGGRAAGASSAVNATPGAGYTERVDVSLGASFDFYTIVVNDQVLGVTGVVGAATQTWAQTISCIPKIGFILKPAPAAGPTVADLFAATLWTGNTTARSITTGIDMTSESAVFVKSRSDAFNWVVFDTLRGVGNYLSTNTANVEAAIATTLTAFNSNGFSLGNSTLVNGNLGTYVGHSFKTASKFFDVITYAGNNIQGRVIPHGLGQVPGMVIAKSVNVANDWVVWHQSLSSGRFILLTASAESASSADEFFGNGTVTVNPDASNITVASFLNTSGTNYVMYVFGHDVATDGVIQCGSYTGNGSAVGPTVTLGWEPQFLMIKARAQGTNWNVYDQARGLSAASEREIAWNLISAETTIDRLILSSTGFQLQTSASGFNTSGQVYLYMAIRKAGT